MHLFFLSILFVIVKLACYNGVSSKEEEHMKLYKCPICGNIVEKVIDHKVPVFCCGKLMEEVVANTSDGAMEKHVPVLKLEDGKLIVEVGSVEHPMLEEHFIEFILVEAGNMVLRADLKPNEKPMAIFDLNSYHGEVTVYEYCNLHGLWKSEMTI